MGQLEDLNVFVRVVEAGGIGRAAEQLGMAKSGVSRRLSELEARLGSRLINRTTRTSSLTEAGRTCYQRAIKILDDVAEMNSLSGDPAAALRGSIHLAVPLSFGLSHLATAISDCTIWYERPVGSSQGLIQASMRSRTTSNSRYPRAPAAPSVTAAITGTQRHRVAR